MQIVNKAVVDVLLRIVVTDRDAGLIADAVDNFLVRALQSDILPELYTQGFVAGECVNTNIVHEWEDSIEQI